MFVTVTVVLVDITVIDVCRFVAEQMVPAVPEPQTHTQAGSNFVCVGLDPMSAADELVGDMAANLKSVVVR